MTLTQFVDFVRNRHNAVSDSFWSDDEIYKLTEGRCQEVMGIIGLSEGVDTSLTTTASTQTYAIPTGYVRIKKLLVNNYPCRQITFEEWDGEHNRGGTDPEGTPDRFFIWGSSIYLVPIPSASSQTITIYGEKQQTALETGVTIEVPSVLHYRLANGVLADMFVKDKDTATAKFYTDIWLNSDIPAFYQYQANKHQSANFAITANADGVEF